MDFELNENQKMITQMVRDFADKNIRPRIMEWDESQEFPVDIMRELGKLGLLGVLVPEEYGGSGFGYMEYITAVSEARMPSLFSFLPAFRPGFPRSMTKAVIP